MNEHAVNFEPQRFCFRAIWTELIIASTPFIQSLRMRGEVHNMQWPSLVMKRSLYSKCSYEPKECNRGRWESFKYQRLLEVWKFCGQMNWKLSICTIPRNKSSKFHARKEILFILSISQKNLHIEFFLKWWQYLWKR